MNKERFLIRSAVYLILLKDDKVLLSRRFKTGWMDGHYSLIAGHLDGNESISDAMIREAKEEADIKIAKKDLIPATVIHRHSPDQEYIDFFFTCKKWKGVPKIMEKNKCDDMTWFDPDDLPEKLLPYIKEAIDNTRKGISFFENGWGS